MKIIVTFGRPNQEVLKFLGCLSELNGNESVDQFLELGYPPLGQYYFSRGTGYYQQHVYFHCKLTQKLGSAVVLAPYCCP